ncbi:MAG: (d)CMP kinase [Rikenellaceae bacterium]
MDKIIIAIDGHSSCGKSTFAKMIAQKLGYVFIDTGAMYRTVTFYALEMGYIAENSIDEASIIASLNNLNITFKYNAEKGKSDAYLNGVNVEDKIRNIVVSNYVSKISAIKEVRELLVKLQQDMGTEKGIVMDGRDIGTTVFPGAELKLFMTASVAVRAERRYKELTEKGENVSLEAIKANVESRDFQDENRTESPLRKADDAIILDNSFMTLEEQMVWIEELLKLKGYDC